MQQNVRPEIKILNTVFIATVTIGTIASVNAIVITNIDIQPLSTRAWIICLFLSISLIALFILGFYSTIDQYIKLEFKDSIFELKKYLKVLWFIFGILINLILITSAAFLMIELTKHHLASLPTYHSKLIGSTTAILSMACFIHALFALFSLVIWKRNFNILLKHTSDRELIQLAARGSGSLLELMIFWILFAGGFFFTSLKLSAAINLHSQLLNQIISITLFTVGILNLLMSFMGSHPPCKCSRTIHYKFSCIAYCIEKCLMKKFNIVHHLNYKNKHSSIARGDNINDTQKSPSENILNPPSEITVQQTLSTTQIGTQSISMYQQNKELDDNNQINIEGSQIEQELDTQPKKLIL